jgi:hypothetical protein
MKSTTAKPTKKTVKKPGVLLKTINFQTNDDLRSSLLVVSMTVNLFFLCLWIALQLTSAYDNALISFFIHR